MEEGLEAMGVNKDLIARRPDLFSLGFIHAPDADRPKISSLISHI